MVVSHNEAHLPEAHRVLYIQDGRIVRVVVNPERKQIKKVEEGESLVTELEQLSRLYPYDTLETLRVRSIRNYVTQEFNFDQLERLSKFIEQVVLGKMPENKFIDLVAKKYSEGGIGSNRLEAKKIATKISKILNASQDIRKFRSNRNLDLAFIYQHKFLKRVEAHLLKEFGQKLTENQKKNLEEALLNRLTGAIGDDELVQSLSVSGKLGGVGLHIKTAYKIASYFEKLLAQGVSHEHISGEI